MTYRGTVKDGVIVLEPGVRLPDGVVVQVEPVEPPAQQPTPLAQRLLRHAGKAQGLPRDAARNHDHYLYGTGKK